ncbi:TldD/PmbA family protein [Chungangia koreensis]|uniref:TldD/PmbA family protein n=1 Tax=Chungangia koreensis TaxID=752657 RepID=A0ABV8X953_9LACT
MSILNYQEKLLAQGKEYGFEAMEVYYEKTSSFGCGVFNGELEHYETAEAGGLSFRGLIDGKMGYAYTEKIDEDSIQFLLERAKNNAGVLESDEMDEIFEGSPAYQNEDWFSESLSKVTIPEKISLMLEIEKKISEYNPKIKLVNGRLKDMAGEKAIANSKGLALHERQNYIYLYFTVVVEDGSEKKSANTFKITRDFSKWNTDEIAKEAAEEVLKSLNEKSVANKKYPVLFRRDAAAAFIATFNSIFSAEEAQFGQSLLAGKSGEKIAADTVTFIDDPFHPLGLSNRNFDSEGVASQELTVVENGVLKTLLHNRKTAKKDGVETTGHAYKSYKGTLSVAPSNFYVKPGVKEYEQLISGLQEGILITELSGLHSGANPVSGDFSVAARGYYVKDGKIEAPTTLMTIAGNFFTVLNDVVEAGSDLEFGPSGVGSPSLLVKGLSVTME